MKRTGIRGLGIVAALWTLALVGCGAATQEDTTASTEQELQQCLPGATYCNDTQTMACDYNGTCRKACEPGGPANQCRASEQCCLGYYNSSTGRLVVPHCAPTCPYPP